MKTQVYFDSDGFFWPSDISNEYMKEQRKEISIEKDDQPFYSIIEQYYLGFRSSIFICEDSVENKEEAMKVLKKWREACFVSAIEYTQKHMTSDVVLPIDFLWIHRMEIINAIKQDFPNADKIQIKLSLKPRISAQVKNSNIIFPALIRSLLIHCNLVLINQSLTIANNELEHINRRQLSRFIIPYLLFCHDDFSVSNLPIISPCSSQAMMLAFIYTNIQVEFIFAHEYAHILLNHSEKYTANNESLDVLENEADSFALNLLIKGTKNEGSYSKEDVFTAIRWLFKYQFLEERIGMLVRGESLSDHFSAYEKRRSAFQSDLIKEYGLSSTSIIDMIGFLSIIEVQNVLNEYGDNLINTIIKAFNKSKQKGELETWWTMITQR